MLDVHPPHQSVDSWTDFFIHIASIVVGLVEASTALILPPSLKSVGIYAVYLLVVFIRPRGLFGRTL